MAVVSGTVWSVDTLKSSSVSRLQIAEVLFTVAGTYDNTAHAQLLGIPTLIQNSRNNGKTVALVGLMVGTPATKQTNAAAFMGMASLAIGSSVNATFNITDGDFSTELANGAVPTQDRPFMLLVAFTETDPSGAIIGA